MADLLLDRRPPITALPQSSPALAMAAVPPATRFILRGRPPALAAAGAALGFTLPQIACRAASDGGRAALWLGPDEYLLLDVDGAALESALAGLAHALVDVSHRQSGLTLAGPLAATVLNAGCPLDLDPAAFPVGMCTRTVLGKVEIVLWRIGPNGFRVEAWRSFLPYVWRYLEEAAREFRA